MAKIIQNHKDCIGCGTCVILCPKFWEISDDGKAILKGAVKKENGDLELEIDEIGCNKDTEDACPVKVIKIE
ncbi:ferredoxin [Patescibacteria group bacterium]|nr:ferredoxin [Patescibacteria group bacterium]